MNKELLKKVGIYAGIILLFAVLTYSFTPQVLSGKIVNQSDISAWKQQHTQRDRATGCRRGLHTGRQCIGQSENRKAAQ